MKQSPRNKTRANRLANALHTVKEYDGALDWPSTVTDALSDLRHLCDKLGLSFGDLDRIAYDHYSAERAANMVWGVQQEQTGTWSAYEGAAFRKGGFDTAQAAQNWIDAFTAD